MKIFSIVTPISEVFTWERAVASGGAATIARGTPTKESSTSVAIMADGEGTTSEQFSGLAKTVSTDTAAAAGTVRCYLPLAGLIYQGSPKVAGAADTVAEINALKGKRIVFDLTSSVWTIDTAASDGIGNAVVITDGQPEQDLVHFVVTHTSFNFFENN